MNVSHDVFTIAKQALGRLDSEVGCIGQPHVLAVGRLFPVSIDSLEQEHHSWQPGIDVFYQKRLSGRGMGLHPRQAVAIGMDSGQKQAVTGRGMRWESALWSRPDRANDYVCGGRRSVGIAGGYKEIQRPSGIG